MQISALALAIAARGLRAGVPGKGPGKTAEPGSGEPARVAQTVLPAKWRQAFCAAATAAMVTGSAAAADLDQQAAAVSFPAGVPAYNWAGFYAGMHMGYAWGNSKWTGGPAGAPAVDSGSLSVSQPVNVFDESGSWFEGVQAGYNYMLPNRIVIGAEADASFSSFMNANTGLSTGGATISPNSLAYYSDNIFASGTVRGRIGYAPGNWLFYATGGLAWTSEQYTTVSLMTGATDSHFAARLGWAAGGGVEAPLTPSWTLRAEYLYTGYGNSTQNFPTNGLRFGSNLSEQEVRLALNYQLNGGGALSGKDAPKPAGLLDSGSVAIHGDLTAFWQGYPAMKSPYELLPGAGGRSLPGGGLAREVMDAGLDVGVRLWQGAEFWVNPEVEQGFGPGNTLGVAGYVNAGAYKLGQTEPYARINRFILRQTFDLGGQTQKVDEGFLNFAGTTTSDRLVLTLGKFTPLDIFGKNTYLNPKTGFFNWQMNLSLPYDFAGDAWTVTYGAAAEYYTGNWTFRAGLFDLSKQPEGGLGAAQGISDDPTFSQYNLVGEIEHRHELWGMPGAIKVLGYYDRGRMASYQDAIAWGIANNTAPDVGYVRKYQTKPGATLNVEQKITTDLAFFAEAGWMDGHYEVFDTSDVDKSLMMGIQISGNRWGLQYDTIGIAGVIDAISKDYQAYLNAGGGGNIIGDGKLPHYGTENIFEIYYNHTISEWASCAIDYQFIQNPAYNADRGPANFIGGRLFLHF
jgi:high affinity Mn2+ porin